MLSEALVKSVFLDCYRLDKIIQAHYGKDYSSIDATRLMECGQDSMFQVDLVNIDELEPRTYVWRGVEETIDPADEYRESMENWVDAQSSPNPSHILSDLYTRGLIPKEYYVIWIWW